MQDQIRDCLGFRIGSAFRRVDRLFNRAFAKLDLSYAHGQVLICLLCEGELRVTEIAQRTGFDPSTVSRLVQGLARRRLVRRRRDPADGRALLLGAGARAEALREEIERLQRRINARLRGELTQADLTGFFHTLEAMERLP